MRRVVTFLALGVVGLGLVGCGDTGEVELQVRPDPGSTANPGRVSMRLTWAGNYANPTADLALDGDEGHGTPLEGRQLLLQFPSIWLRDGAEIPVNRSTGADLSYFDVKGDDASPEWQELSTGWQSGPGGNEFSRGWYATCGMLKVREHAVIGDGLRRFVIEGQDIRLYSFGHDGQMNVEPITLDIRVRVHRSDYIFPEDHSDPSLTSFFNTYTDVVPPAYPPAPVCDNPTIDPPVVPGSTGVTDPGAGVKRPPIATSRPLVDRSDSDDGR